MNQTRKSKQYNLEESTLEFSRETINFTKSLPRTLANIEIIKQLIRTVGSVGANYIEANESLSKRDFVMRIKICKKEAKETRYWLRLIEVRNKSQEDERDKLTQESTELMKIFGSILEKTKKKRSWGYWTLNSLRFEIWDLEFV